MSLIPGLTRIQIAQIVRFSRSSTLRVSITDMPVMTLADVLLNVC